MAHRGPGSRSQFERGIHPDRVSRASRRVGFALLGAAVPALCVVLGVALLTGSLGSGPLQWLARAMETSLRGGRGLQWAFHVSALTALFGLWAVGLSLVVEGYFDVE